MIMKLYTIYDVIAEECAPIFQAKTHGVARRKIVDLAKKEAINPKEYQLLYLGTFDSEKTELKPVEVPELIDYENLLVEHIKADREQMRMFGEGFDGVSESEKVSELIKKVNLEKGEKNV